MTAPRELHALVETFDRNLDAYKSGGYKEAQVRKEFVDPFFELLGWDVANKRGYAEPYKDVIHEDTVKIGGFTKAPDYCFRIGGTRKFFVEAKKPSIDIKGEPSSAYQLRRYAWSAKLPLSILTDFEEFAVYDCRLKPAKMDRSATARTLYITYDRYSDRWDEIASIFSRDAILKGSFDKYAESTKGKRGTAEVDTAFLQEIEAWRDMLARNLALRNLKLSQRELNFAVQATIDRIIFLRICEDRGIEQYSALMALLGSDHIYGRLLDRFRDADDRYNSGLFHFRKEKDRPEPPDTLTPGLVIDDKPLQSIINGLYYPDSPYEFSVLPADILGQVYEQFLGKVIRLTPGHRAVVEDKPEAKKAGGVYYTPTYIVDYIVKNTVGSLLEGKTLRQAKKLRILDPACGSGSFLIGAYQYLLDWHRDRYVEDDPEKHTRAKRLYPAMGGEWRLTTRERRRILLGHIYGVDIDPQAVEVTKLSLLLKVLEGASGETLGAQFRLFRERALPDLADNIKCGNSLIGPDFYENQQFDLLDEEERYRINVFDWEAGFPEIMKAGGFDAVIGNPPYGADYTDAEKEYFQSEYVYKKGKPETYIFFLERGNAILTASGMLGFITPNAWLTNYYGVQMRRYIFEHASFKHLVDLEPTKVFQKSVVDTVITISSKDTRIKVREKTEVWRGTKDHQIAYEFAVDQSVWESDPQAIINVQANPVELVLLARIQQTDETLDRLVEYSQGIIPYKTKAEGKANLYIGPQKHGGGWFALIENASQVRRYEIDKPKTFIRYGPWLWCPRDPRFFVQPKILFHRLRKKLPVQLVGAMDETGAINRHALSNLILRPGLPRETLFAVLGLFNSKLANWWLVKKYGLLMEVGGFKVGKMPLPRHWNVSHGRMVELVERMLALHKRLAAAKTAHDKTVLQRQIDATDREIDQLVYELYGLTDDEIAIVEEATPNA